MRIKTSTHAHTLYRYAGQIDGKNLETRIGAVPTGTKPAEISPEVLEDLTPREMRELADFLTQEQTELARLKSAALIEDLSLACSLCVSGTLDQHSVEKLGADLLKASSIFNRELRKRVVKAVTASAPELPQIPTHPQFDAHIE